MGVRDIYQTLQYRDNNLEVLKSGPGHCSRNDSWLYHGYYFWEESTKPAHYWGKKWCGDCFIICSAKCDIDEDNCLDLVGNIKHDEYFTRALSKLVELEELTEDSTVQHVIKWLKDHDQFPFYASRAETSDSFDMSEYLTEEDFAEKLIYDTRLTRTKLKLNKAIQLCIYNLEEVNFRDFDIIFEKS